MTRPRAAIGAVLLLVALPTVAAAQSTATASEGRRPWFAIGGGAATFRGACQFCEIEGDYRHTGSLLVDAGAGINKHVDVGGELLWVRDENPSGDEVRTTFVVAVAQFRPWASKGFFVKGGAGMAFVRNWVFELDSPSLQKALSIHIGAGWEFPVSRRLGVELFAAQHAAALGDFETQHGVVQDVMGNFWSIGGALVIR